MYDERNYDTFPVKLVTEKVSCSVAEYFSRTREALISYPELRKQGLHTLGVLPQNQSL